VDTTAFHIHVILIGLTLMTVQDSQQQHILSCNHSWLQLMMPVPLAGAVHLSKLETTNSAEHWPSKHCSNNRLQVRYNQLSAGYVPMPWHWLAAQQQQSRHSAALK
jgi:hypothetical protein